tara:strand:+ start:1441 stop:2031 length:591 start_codon:yes stop_codon:yes gene_type:complete
MEWDFYNKMGDYSGKATGHWGSNIAVGDKGFGGGHARRAIEAGYSPLAIQQWMDKNKPAPHLGGNSSWQAWNIINPAVQQQKAMESLYSHFSDRFQGLDDKYQAAGNYATAGAWDEDIAALKKEGEEGRRKNAGEIQKAMQEAQKVRQNNPYAVIGNQAMGIQQAQSPGQVAGQISAGLAGFSRNQKKFQTKTLNV